VLSWARGGVEHLHVVFDYEILNRQICVDAEGGIECVNCLSVFY